MDSRSFTEVLDHGLPNTRVFTWNGERYVFSTMNKLWYFTMQQLRVSVPQLINFLNRQLDLYDKNKDVENVVE
ncbi:MAG: hypothetical protein JNL36_07780 [Candidatus Kapabacteria bacterium]|nr:hypothetical protein [Candidatus Kapabacteria bacterium]